MQNSGSHLARSGLHYSLPRLPFLFFSLPFSLPFPSLLFNFFLSLSQSLFIYFPLSCSLLPFFSCLFLFPPFSLFSSSSSFPALPFSPFLFPLLLFSFFLSPLCPTPPFPPSIPPFLYFPMLHIKNNKIPSLIWSQRLSLFHTYAEADNEIIYKLSIFFVG